MILAHQQPPAVAYNFMFSPPARRLLENHYGVTDLEQALGLPIRMSGPRSIKPLYADPDEFGEKIKDEFGVVWTTSKIDRGVPVIPCLTDPDLSGYKFPDPAVSYRFDHLARWCEDNKEHYTILWVGDLWERATFMRGMENILLDVALNRKFIEQLLDNLKDYILQTMEILFERFQFEGVALSDDYGTQRAMLISPADWRKLIKPRLAEIYSAAKAHNRIVFHHSCGNIEPIIPDMIDIGLDILHPIQPEAMDILKLKREYAGRLTFCGGLGTQELLPNGTPGQIRQEVKRLKREMGAGGEYILEPGITIQADVSLENMLAMLEEAQTEGFD